jgi:hypothetical protein
MSWATASQSVFIGPFYAIGSCSRIQLCPWIGRSTFEITSRVEAFGEDEEGYGDCGMEIKAGSLVWAAVDDDELRMLEASQVKAILFTRGERWLWMPKTEFDRVAKKVTQTG